ncbi:chemotaxis protein CheW [Nocardioides caldifontis]|uniref:chemotaxis protein CheW n=1 Tax=Nocardioides caldifontis TaxID=2588938 RepID=UPI0011DFCBAF|nr:chemotaxis protein CheW [Nocardioides caldifontis]
MSHQYCTFVLDGHLFGVPVASVQEVLKQQEVTPVPLASREVSGLINLRGQIVTTIDLRARLGLSAREAGSSSVSVVVRAADGGPVSLVVDQIGDVLEAEESLLEPPPDTVPHEVRELVMGICKLDDRLMLLLDTERAVTVTELVA